MRALSRCSTLRSGLTTHTLKRIDSDICEHLVPVRGLHIMPIKAREGPVQDLAGDGWQPEQRVPASNASVAAERLSTPAHWLRLRVRRLLCLGRPESPSHAMPATRPTPLSFLLSRLKRNPKADYASLRKAAEKRKLEVWPVMFGRAKALLGLVPMARRGQGKAAKATAAKKPGKRGRPVSADSKSAKIRELLKKGGSPAEIAKQVGATVSLVYTVRSNMGAAMKRGPGRPPKAKLPSRRGPGRPRKATGVDGLDGLVTAIREQTKQAQQLRAALEKVRELVAGALG